MIDLLLLAISRLPNGLAIAGMTTEPDPITGLRWVRPIGDSLLVLDDLRFADGSLARPGDVIHVELGEPLGAPPHVENVAIISGFDPVTKVRSLTDARREKFFPAYLDQSPKDVLGGRTRSLCLVKPDDFHAVFAIDEDGRYETRFVDLHIGRARSEDGLPINDIYWRAWGKQHVNEDEPFAEFAADELRAILGDIYVVIGLNRRGTASIVGVHTLQALDVTLDEQAL